MRILKKIAMSLLLIVALCSAWNISARAEDELLREKVTKPLRGN